MIQIGGSMNYYHHSRDAKCKEPYGALAQNERVNLTLYIAADEEALISRVDLVYHYGLNEFMSGKSRMHAAPLCYLPDLHQPMVPYTFRLRAPGTKGLLFYYFQIHFKDGRAPIYIHKEAAPLAGALVSEHEPRVGFASGDQEAFRITIYDDALKTPDFFKGRLMYQIFPDRFARGEDATFRMEQAKRQSNAKERIFHESFHEDVDFLGKPETGYMACDFFGGTLLGIQNHLDDLREMGVSILYFNPIFRARSNHRYDAADYMQIDPLLGDEEDFRRLCAEAAARRMKIVLDVSFSHTGADSRYFNKYGRFDSIGAWQEAKGEGLSDYSSWYHFYQPLGAALQEGQEPVYESWWGFTDLPSVNENDLQFRDYILGEEGVVRHWLRQGAEGFRLDVSDELPDDFLRDLYHTVKTEKPSALVLGEVWEDASAKISYGHYRDFVYGNTHDSVMGYPFRNAVIRFIKGQSDAAQMNEALEEIREHYPPEIFAVSMHHLGTHDTARFVTEVAGAPDPGTRELQVKQTLSQSQRERGERAYLLAASLMLAYPGMPSIYYGDEYGMEGYRDPFNRRPIERNRKTPLTAAIKRLGRLRQAHTVLETGHYRLLHAEGSVFAFERYAVGDQDAFGHRIHGVKRAAAVLVRDPVKYSFDYMGQRYEIQGPRALWILGDELIWIDYADRDGKIIEAD